MWKGENRNDVTLQIRSKLTKINGVQTVGRKTSWAKDVWANFILGDARFGDKLGRHEHCKSDVRATFFRWLGEMCERGETQN